MALNKSLEPTPWLGTRFVLRLVEERCGRSTVVGGAAQLHVMQTKLMGPLVPSRLRAVPWKAMQMMAIELDNGYTACIRLTHDQETDPTRQ